MTLQEAIEILTDMRNVELLRKVELTPSALKLGIKALKLLENPTDPRLLYARKLLLGETKEKERR